MSFPSNSTMTHRRSKSGEGFTIIELLVVVAIIALLLGLILTGLQSARRASMKTNETNNLRQYGAAWQVYGNNYKDSAIPGYLDPTPAAGMSIQQLWKVKYELPDHTQITNENDTAPYTWRLLPYMDYSHEISHFYTNEDDYSPQAMIAEVSSIANEPAFGYNAYYVGGWWKTIDVNGAPQAQCMYTASSLNNPAQKNQVLLSIARVPAELIVFCSSSELTGPNVHYKHFAPNIKGSHYVSPPIRDHTQQWQAGDLYLVPPAGGASGNMAHAPDSYGVEVLSATTSAPIGRYNGSAAICRGDGSIATDTPGGLADQRKWLYQANDRRYEHDP